MLPRDKTIELRVGNAVLRHPLTPVPSNNSADGAAEWMCYFDSNSTRFTEMVEETCRLTAERIRSCERRTVVLAPETAPVAIAHVLRSRYGIAVQNIGKKKRPHMSAKTMREDYSAVTSTTVNSLYFDGFDEEIKFDAETTECVLLDNVVTTGGTFTAAARLLHRWYPTAVIREAIVMFTEGYVPFSTLSLDNGETVPIHALGGHIPIFRERDIAGAVALRPPQFVFKSSARFPTYFKPSANIQFAVFENSAGAPAVAVVGPNTFDGHHERWNDVVVRVHDACLTSECFFSCKCDCREQLEQAMRHICEHGGIVVYLFQEGRGIGLANKIRAYYFQTMANLDTVEANRALGLPDDARSYVAVRDILHHYGIDSIKLMTNNPRKIEQLEALGVKVTGRVSAEVTVASPLAARYQYTKSLSMGHQISADHFEAALRQTADAVKVLRFYEPEDENGWMSNFFPSPIVAAGVTYPTVEHYYQSRKFTHPKGAHIHDAIVAAPTAAEAFRLARANDTLKRDDWEVHKKRDMFRGLMLKFKQHADLRERLVSTGDALILEASPVDRIWGVGADGTGQNLMGRMLCNIRQALCEHVFDPTHPLMY